MPTVRYGGRKVGTDALAGVRKSAAETPISTGAGVAAAQEDTARALGRLGETVSQLGTERIADERARELQEQDEVVNMAAARQLSDWDHATLHDAKTGAFNTVKGKDALGLTEKVTADYDQFTSTLGAGMSPRQQARFQREVEARRASMVRAIDGYTAEQMDAYETSETKAAIASSVRNAVTNTTADPLHIGEELARTEQIITTFTAHKGLGPAVRDEMLGKVRTEIHSGVIEEQLAQGHAHDAAFYFGLHKDQIAPDERHKIEKALAVGATRADAQTATAKILAEGGTLKEQRAKARAIADPEVQDSVMQRLEHEQTIKDRDEKIAEEQTLSDAYTTVDKSHTVDSIPPTTWATLPGSARSALRGYAQTLAKGTPVETDQVTYYMLKEAATTDPAAFLQTNLLTFKNKLSDSDFQELTGLRGAIRTGNKAAADKVLDDFRSTGSVVKNALTLAGLDPSPKADDVEGHKRIAQFDGLVAAEVRRVQDITGKKLQNSDLEAIANRILAQQIQHVDKGWIWNTTTTRSLGAATVDDIPAADMTQILDSLTRHGQPATPEAALGIWLRAQARKGGP